jgi:hypothetical protein
LHFDVVAEHQCEFACVAASTSGETNAACLSGVLMGWILVSGRSWIEVNFGEGWGSVLRFSHAYATGVVDSVSW